MENFCRSIFFIEIKAFHYISSLTSNDLLLNVVEMSDTLFLSKPPRNAPSTFAPPSNPYNIHRPSVAILLRFLLTKELPTQSRTILTPPPAKNRCNIVYILLKILYTSAQMEWI